MAEKELIGKFVRLEKLPARNSKLNWKVQILLNDDEFIINDIESEQVVYGTSYEEFCKFTELNLKTGIPWTKIDKNHFIKISNSGETIEYVIFEPYYKMNLKFVDSLFPLPDKKTVYYPFEILLYEYYKKEDGSRNGHGYCEFNLPLIKPVWKFYIINFKKGDQLIQLDDIYFLHNKTLYKWPYYHVSYDTTKISICGNGDYTDDYKSSRDATCERCKLMFLDGLIKGHYGLNINVSTYNDDNKYPIRESLHEIYTFGKDVQKLSNDELIKVLLQATTDYILDNFNKIFIEKSESIPLLFILIFLSYAPKKIILEKMDKMFYKVPIENKASEYYQISQLVNLR